MGRLLRSVKLIIVLGRDMQELIRKKRKDRPERVLIATNWGDVDQVYPLPRDENPLLRQWGLVDKFVIQNAGNMGWIHDADLLVRTAELLRSEQDMHFLMVCSGRRVDEMQRLIRERGLTNITFEPMRPRSEALAVHNACDVAISVFIPGMYGLAVPSRIYNVMASGKALIAVTDPGSEMARVIEEERVGWVVPAGDPAAFARACRSPGQRRGTPGHGAPCSCGSLRKIHAGKNNRRF